MSWIKLSTLENHLIGRLGGPNSYGSLRRCTLGIFSDAIEQALRGGSIPARGFRGAGKQMIAFATSTEVKVCMLRDEITLNGQRFTEVEIGAKQFDAYCDKVLDLEVDSTPVGRAAIAPKPRMSDAELNAWIANCPTENSKKAYKMLRDKCGSRAPKRAEVFMPAWRIAKGNRKRGRIKNSQN